MNTKPCYQSRWIIISICLHLAILQSACNSDFEAIEGLRIVDEIDLLVTLTHTNHHASCLDYDSIQVQLYNPKSSIIIKQRVHVDSVTHKAVDTIANLKPGDWKISIHYFETVRPGHEGKIKRLSTTMNINSQATGFFSDGISATIHNSDGIPTKQRLNHDELLVFYLPGSDSANAVVTLPADPLDPFFEVSLPDPAWSYFYADRTFYETRPNEPGSNYVIGSAAFEKYNEDHQAIDYVDTTRFKGVTETVRSKNWSRADALIIFYIGELEQPIFYYQWNR